MLTEQHSSASSLHGFLEIIETLVTHVGADRSTQPLWYRGQSSEQWPLLPKLYREEGVEQFERERHRDFIREAPALVAHSAGYALPSNPMDWMCLMQHHGLATRLLDWTESAMAALWFAVRERNDANGVVWVLDPWQLNQQALGVPSVPLSSEERLLEYVLNRRQITARAPAAFRSSVSNTRLSAQRGVFTVHGRETEPLTASVPVHAVRIPREYCPVILRQLARNDCTHQRFFPGLDGLAARLNFEFSIDYLADSDSGSQLHRARATPTRAAVERRIDARGLWGEAERRKTKKAPK